ncbi:MAG TPA: hypothetical protein VJ863_07435 [Sphaerochaeta sp.]|nr:hypothetical protein [Sphaerochaeta sp.]
MKNTGVILLSAGVLLIGFALLTPLLLFLIGLVLHNTVDGSMLLEMECSPLSFIGLVLLVPGSLVSRKHSLGIGIASGVALLAMVGCLSPTFPKGIVSMIATICYYLSLFVALGLGIAILHTKHPSQE